jgi:hypothetical protein
VIIIFKFEIFILTPNATGMAQFWRLTDSNFFVLLDDLLYSALRASPYGSPKSGDQIENFVFLHAQKESKQRKRHPTSPSMAKKRHRVNSGRHAPRPKGRPCGRSKRLSCRFVILASQITEREKLACGSNSFPLNPLLAPVLSGAEGLGGRGEYFGEDYRNSKMKIL